MKPILFSTAMVQAILAGNKTQTRRVVKPQPESMEYITIGHWERISGGKRYAAAFGCNGVINEMRKPRFSVGDILYVRETWARVPTTAYIHSDGVVMTDAGNYESYIYRAGWERSNPKPWKPSLFMPRDAARLFLRVTAVRPERVQDITEEDAKAEGVPKGYIVQGKYSTWTKGSTHKTSFEHLWDSLNAKRGYGWEANPWVWVYAFEKISTEEAQLVKKI